MICEPSGPCADVTPPLGVTPPDPGMALLRRRLGHFAAFVDDLVRRTELRELAGEPLGRTWDVEGDPHAIDLVHLWAFVAEGVAAYAELAAGESYLATARDWTALARLADQVGYRPAQRVAAEGWVRFDTDRTSSPVVPAGTLVQASGTPERDPQTYEVMSDTQLLADWGELTATWVPTPARPDGRKVRFLGDPGLRAGDEVLLLVEEAPPPAATDWLIFLLWIFGIAAALPDPQMTPIAVLNVVGHESELGTTLVEFDRDMADLMSGAPTTSYTAYRIVDQATSARRVRSVLTVEGTSASPVDLDYGGTTDRDDRFVVLDRRLDDLSAESLVAVVEWNDSSPRGDVARVERHVPVEWDVVPGTSIAASKLTFADDVGTLAVSGPLNVYVLDRRVVATHYEFPTEAPAAAAGAGLRLRVWPAPATSAPPSGKLAVQTTTGGGSTWELLDVAASTDEETAGDDADVRPGRLLDLVDHAPVGDIHLAPASGNVVRVRHGTAVAATLPGGDGVTPEHRVELPDAPVAAVLGDDGTPASSVEIHLDGRRWTERPTLFAAGPVDGYETRLGPDGEVVVRFGDGEHGAIPPSGTANLVATYRIGGGTDGEVGSGEIDTLLGSIRGVRSVAGAGPTAGASDQPSEAALRREAPTRARALDRVVSIGDLADLALAYPGVSHATAWIGASPTGTTTGTHVAVLRTGSSGVRAALPPELSSLSTYLDARRDVALPLSVVTGHVIAVSLSVDVVTRDDLIPADVAAAVLAALTDPGGVLAAEQRALGQALDRSDVVAVVHSVAGVAGIAALTLSTDTLDASTAELGRLPADRHELLVVADPQVTAVTA